MFAVSKKIFLAFVVLATVLTTGAWQSTPVAVVKSQNADSIETPLYPGLTWSSIGVESRDIRINASGDSFSVSGEKFEAQERFMAGVSLPQDVVDYYSNEQLAASGWESFDVVSGEEGTHYVFSHESGVYFMVDFVACQDDASRTCVSVWKSEPVSSTPEVAPAITSDTDAQTATGSFSKKSPTNGSTNVSATSLTLSWNAYSPTPDKYTYCINVGSACADNDPDWTSVSGTSVTVSNLGYNKTYYWQVKAVTCVTCTPKTKVDADGGTWWKFTTKSNADVIILGNAGVAGAVLSYVNSTAKTVTADGTGAYSITVPLNWSGTITPSKTGYRFSPASASFTNVTAAQIIQNFAATAIFTISGNAGVGGAVLSYTDGTPKTVTADTSGNYSITLPAGWSGTITPSTPAYSFSPSFRSYTNLAANQTAQNYTATFVTYTVSGNVGAPGVTVNFTNIYPGKFVTGANGAYSFIVPKGWSGTVTPSHPCYSFSPASTPYTNVQANQSQDYSPTVTNLCVAAILQAGTSPTNASSVNFSVYFTKSVTGVDTSDFDLTTAGVTGAAITGVTPVSGATYTVSVSTGSGNGTIRLDLIDDGTIQAGSETLDGDFTTGEIYTILRIPTFADVTVFNQYYADIEVLYANHLTGGCAITPLLKYCPDMVMDRAQGAVFIMRADNGASYVPSPVTYQFQDDWTKGPWARPWAEVMREANLTAGCKITPALLYCPWQSLPREQVVIYALKLKYGNNYTPPPATGTIFADMTDPTFYATAWAEQAYKDELIPACGVSGGKPLFCPKNTASRGLGAYIIVRSKGLITP